MDERNGRPPRNAISPPRNVISPPRNVISPPRNVTVALVAALAVVVGLTSSVLVSGLRERTANPSPDIAAGDGAGAGTSVPAMARRPVTAPRPVFRLAGNPLTANEIHVSPAVCELPPIEPNASSMGAFHRSAARCLDRSWAPALTAAGLPFAEVTLDLTDGAAGACGQSPSITEATGFYCDGDQTIFLPSDRLPAHLGTAPGPHVALLAHEYGHHVQSLAGILAAAADAGATAGDGGRMELTRRLELQANCFSGAFLASIRGTASLSPAQIDAAVAVFAGTAHDERHGTHANQVRWARSGFAGGPAACDTWAAPADKVG